MSIDVGVHPDADLAVGDWSMSDGARTMASTPAWASASTLSNWAVMVSVKTRVPAMRVTPRSTANTVLSSRILRATSSLMVSVNMISFRSVASGRGPSPGVGSSIVGDDAAVGEEDGPVGVRGGDRVVGDHHDRLAELADRDSHERQHLAAAVGVEVAGRFVGEDDLRAGHQGTGHRDSLLLTAGELRRPVARVEGASPTVSTTWSNQSASTLRPASRAGSDDVLGGGERRHEVERLEDEPDPVASELGEPTIVERRDVDVADVNADPA